MSLDVVSIEEIRWEMLHVLGEAFRNTLPGTEGHYRLAGWSKILATLPYGEEYLDNAIKALDDAAGTLSSAPVARLQGVIASLRRNIVTEWQALNIPWWRVIAKISKRLESRIRKRDRLIRAEMMRLSAQEQQLVETWWERVARGAIRLERDRAPLTRDRYTNRTRVKLGASSPRAARLGQEFTARFVAYPETQEISVREQLAKLAPRAAHHLNLGTCRWPSGARVEVRLGARSLHIHNPSQTFVWERTIEFLNFDILVPGDTCLGDVALKFDVTIEGFPVIQLRIDLRIEGESQDQGTNEAFVLVPHTAFASYSRRDISIVVLIVGALEVVAGIDVFLDCLSLRTGKKWQETITRAIHERDVFLLFWSRAARESEWVRLECQTALTEKREESFRIHVLEPDVPPFEELKHLHFGSIHALVAKHYKTDRSNAG